MHSDQILKVAVVTGESSGDILAAHLINTLKELHNNIDVIAVGGEKLKQTGVKIIQDNSVFSVMGVFEILKDLSEILRIKKHIVKKIIDYKPDVFIGVDAPDLNFSIAKQLKKQGIPIVHYVSPSVWAWRPGRIDKMAQFIDCLLTLFPFEPQLYQDTGLKAYFCGHPTANAMPLKIDKKKRKQQLGVDPDRPLLAILPGSRKREIAKMSPIFSGAIVQLKDFFKDWQLATANVSDDKCDMSLKLFEKNGLLRCVKKESATDVLQAADYALVASGTVALEAMLCKTPMLVSYKISPLTSMMVKMLKMIQLPYFSLPNVLHGGFLVPELMQENATVSAVSDVLEKNIQQDHQAVIKRFTEIHRSIQSPDRFIAAKSVLNFMGIAC